LDCREKRFDGDRKFRSIALGVCRDDERVPVGEVVVQRRFRYARRSRHIAKPKSAFPLFFNQPHGGIEDLKPHIG
jgi:hypothetical protein